MLWEMGVMIELKKKQLKKNSLTEFGQGRQDYVGLTWHMDLTVSGSCLYNLKPIIFPFHLPPNQWAHTLCKVRGKRLKKN